MQKKREELPFYLNLVCVHLDRTKCIPLFPFSQVSFLLFWKSTCDYAINSLKLGGPLEKAILIPPPLYFGKFQRHLCNRQDLNFSSDSLCIFNKWTSLPPILFLPTFLIKRLLCICCTIFWIKISNCLLCLLKQNWLKLYCFCKI